MEIIKDECFPGVRRAGRVLASAAHILKKKGREGRNEQIEHRVKQNTETTLCGSRYDRNTSLHICTNP